MSEPPVPLMARKRMTVVAVRLVGSGMLRSVQTENG